MKLSNITINKTNVSISYFKTKNEYYYYIGSKKILQLDTEMMECIHNNFIELDRVLTSYFNDAIDLYYSL